MTPIIGDTLVLRYLRHPPETCRSAAFLSLPPRGFSHPHSSLGPPSPPQSPSSSRGCRWPQSPSLAVARVSVPAAVPGTPPPIGSGMGACCQKWLISLRLETRLPRNSCRSATRRSLDVYAGAGAWPWPWSGTAGEEGREEEDEDEEEPPPKTAPRRISLRWQQSILMSRRWRRWGVLSTSYRSSSTVVGSS